VIVIAHSAGVSWNHRFQKHLRWRRAGSKGRVNPTSQRTVLLTTKLWASDGNQTLHRANNCHPDVGVDALMTGHLINAVRLKRTQSTAVPVSSTRAETLKKVTFADAG
jgi:hypothetical protein